MTRFFSITIACALLLSACGPRLNPALVPGPNDPRPQPRPGSFAAPAAGANTADAFDTTSEADRSAAREGGTAGEGRSLGTTVAALGSPANPGFWLETPLVREVSAGRVVDAASGAALALELRPLDAEVGAGSRISLPALRAMRLSLGGLHTLEVFVLD